MSRLIALPTALVMQSTLERFRQNKGIGVGGCATGMPNPKATDPRCTDPRFFECCHDIVTGSALALNGQESARIQIEPMNSPYFKPCAVALVVKDSTDPGLDRTARVYDVSIQNCPQLGFRNQAPVAADEEFIYSDLWDPKNRNGCACPIGWGTFSNRSNSYPLEITVFNPHPIGVFVDINFAILGDPMQRPPGCGCGHDKGGLPAPGRVTPVA